MISVWQVKRIIASFTLNEPNIHHIKSTLHFLTNLILQLIFIDIPDLIGLNTKISKGLFLGTVIENFHQGWEISSECYPLMVTKGFSQSMPGKVSLQINFPTP